MNQPNDYGVRLPPPQEIAGLTPVVNDDQRPRKDLTGKGRKARRPERKAPAPVAGETAFPANPDDPHDVDALA